MKQIEAVRIEKDREVSQLKIYADQKYRDLGAQHSKERASTEQVIDGFKDKLSTSLTELGLLKTASQESNQSSADEIRRLSSALNAALGEKARVET